jgi:hypothetical protein
MPADRLRHARGGVFVRLRGRNHLSGRLILNFGMGPLFRIGLQREARCCVTYRENSNLKITAAAPTTTMSTGHSSSGTSDRSKEE